MAKVHAVEPCKPFEAQECNAKPQTHKLMDSSSEYGEEEERTPTFYMEVYKLVGPGTLAACVLFGFLLVFVLTMMQLGLGAWGSCVPYAFGQLCAAYGGYYGVYNRDSHPVDPHSGKFKLLCFAYFTTYAIGYGLRADNYVSPPDDDALLDTYSPPLQPLPLIGLILQYFVAELVLHLWYPLRAHKDSSKHMHNLMFVILSCICIYRMFLATPFPELGTPFILVHCASRAKRERLSSRNLDVCEVGAIELT